MSFLIFSSLLFFSINSSGTEPKVKKHSSARLSFTSRYQKALQTALDKLSEKERQKILEGIETNKPIAEIYFNGLAGKKIRTCTEKDYTKLRGAYSLPLVLLTFKHSTLYSQRFHRDVDRVKLRVNELGFKGRLSGDPLLEKWFKTQKKFNQSLLKRVNDPERDFRNSQRKAKAAAQFKKNGLKGSAENHFKDVERLIPNCLLFKNHKAMRGFAEQDRMREEAKFIVKRLQEYYKTTKKIPWRVSKFSERDDLVNVQRDAWHRSYLIQKTKTEVIVRSLGPDGLLSDDDLALGRFSL